MARRVAWLVVYAVAMAYLEAAVVVYLRDLYYPQGFSFPLAPMPVVMAAVEIGREAATLVMLLGVSMLAGGPPRALPGLLREPWTSSGCVALVLLGWPPRC
jgi:hypothetical protein